MALSLKFFFMKGNKNVIRYGNVNEITEEIIRKDRPPIGFGSLLLISFREPVTIGSTHEFRSFAIAREISKERKTNKKPIITVPNIKNIP